MNYEEAINYIRNTHKFGTKLGLERIKNLMELLNNPHKKLNYIHIAGTNGKGSTASFIFNMLKQEGYKVGLFTSPYIQRFNERIKVNDEEITNDEIARYLTTIREKIETSDYKESEHPTEFEILTAMSFMHYLEKECDIVVLEVGIGGSIDSTNIIESSIVSVITTISYDHMDLLGNTLEEIAEKKAGIIKYGGKVAVYPQRKEVMEVIKKVCKEKQAMLFEVSAKDVVEKYSTLEAQCFDYKELKNLKISMLGKHQILNSALAVETIKILDKTKFKVSEDNIRKGLLYAKWPGRLEVVSKDPIFVIDGAHNIQGTDNLLKNLKHIFKNKKFIFLVGVLKDKEYESMLLKFIDMAEQFITVTPNLTPRGLDAKELANFLSKYHDNVKAAKDVQEGIKIAMEDTLPNKTICAFGSLYYIGEVRDYFGI